MQEEYKNVRVENGKYKLSLTELNGELEARSDKITSLEVQVSKLSSQCEVSFHILNNILTLGLPHSSVLLSLF